MSFLPTSSMTARKIANLPSMMTTERADLGNRIGRGLDALEKPGQPGRRTSSSTIAMSCTMGQPTVMRPRSVSTSRRSCKRRSSTTVLATESATPKMTPAPGVQPSDQPSPMPSGTPTRPCAIAPGMAIPRTASKS